MIVCEGCAEFYKDEDSSASDPESFCTEECEDAYWYGEFEEN